MEQTKQNIKNGIEDKGVYAEEYRVIHPDGSIRWIYEAGRVVERKDEKPLRVISVLFDITERKKLEQQKEDFLSIASHELKTPVTSIKAYGELLQETFEEIEDLESVSLLRKMNAQINRLNSLISDLLDTTKIQKAS